METIQVGDTEVRYEVRGEGEPVICLHANPFVDRYLPLFERMPGYAFLRYSRRPLDDAPLSIARDAATCRQLADHVGWERAHIIGHSAGALTALQLAVDAPELVHTLCLLEPAVPSPSSDGDGTGDEDPFVPILQAYVAGDYEAAMERFLVRLMVEQPDAMAAALTQFFGTHPISRPSRRGSPGRRDASDRGGTCPTTTRPSSHVNSSWGSGEPICSTWLRNLASPTCSRTALSRPTRSRHVSARIATRCTASCAPLLNSMCSQKDRTDGSR